MKKVSFIFSMLFCINGYAQSGKYDYVKFNKLTEVEGTEFVYTRVDEWSKKGGGGDREQYLLFINTKNGESHQPKLPNDGFFRRINQLKLDSLSVNCLIIEANTTDFDGKNGIDWYDPTQIFVLSTDGKQLTQLTENNLFVSSWIVNKKTGNLVVTGYYDSNKNGKHDKEDKNEISVYDLKTLRLISKV